MLFSIKKTIAVLCTSFLACLACLIFLLSSPPQQRSTIWNDYRILAVDITVDPLTVENAIEKAGINQYASITNSVIKARDSLAPVQPWLIAINKERERWFVNHEEGIRYFFLEDSVKINDALISELDLLKGSFTLESGRINAGLIYVLLGVGLIATLILFKRDYRSGLAGIPFLFAAAASSNLSIFTIALFLAVTAIVTHPFVETVSSRAILMKRARKYRVFIGFTVILMCLAIPFSLRGFFVLIVSLISYATYRLFSHSLITVRDYFLQRFRLHPRFGFSYMHPRWDNFPISAQNIVKAIILIGILTAARGPILSVNHNGSDTDFGVLSIPVPSGYNEFRGFSQAERGQWLQIRGTSTLPDLADYIHVKWNIDSFPWKRAGTSFEIPDTGDRIVQQVWKVSESGVLTEEESLLSIFDDDYIRNALSKDLPGLENMLKKQGRYVSAKITRQHTDD